MTATEFFATWYPAINYHNNKLSLRETQVLKLIMQGYTNKEIGSKLYISSKTAESHRTNVYSKINPRTVYGTKAHRSVTALMFPIWMQFSEEYAKAR